MQFVIDYFIPVFYICLLAWLLQRNKNFRACGIKPYMIVVFFVAKCLSGIIMDYISLRYFENGGDISSFYQDGLSLYHLLLNNPSAFDDRIFEMFSQGGGSLLQSQGAVAKSAFEGIKFIHFFLNIFSFGNLYSNTILFNGIATFVFIRCWCITKTNFGTWLFGAWLFLFPSAFFYTSAIHKEGIMFILIGLLIPLCMSLTKSVSAGKLAAALFYIALFVFFKFFVAALFVAAMVLYWLMNAFPRQRIAILAVSLLGAIILFFLSDVIWPAHGLPQVIVRRQQEFLALEASSSFAMQVLEPSFGSFLRALPGAIYNAVFRPLPGQGGKLLYYVHTLEIYSFWAAIIYMFIKNKYRLNGNLPGMVIALLIFALANLVIIGYTIPNIGATMRYRSIFLPFMGLFAWYLLNGPLRFNVAADIKNSSKPMHI